VFPVTPTGVGDGRHLTHGAINLDTHIQDLVNIVEMESINDVVLVGHSYGGMVVTGGSGYPGGSAPWSTWMGSFRRTARGPGTSSSNLCVAGF
jgi:hypothetical protein